MSLARKAVIGAIWTISTSVGSRAIGLIGTLVITRFLTPAQYGEVSVASVVVMAVTALTSLGFGQYVVANPKAGRDVVFHATFFYVTVGLVALGLVTLARAPLGPLFDAPRLPLYIPGIALAMALERLAYMPTRLLARDMRFNVLGVRSLLAEITYAGVAAYLAWAGWGGYAVMWAILARSVVGAIIVIGSVERRAWLSPSKIRWETTKVLARFGLPLNAAGILQYAAKRGDNLIIAAIFGPAVVGQYNMAYNLADIPATQVGEQIGDVLLPSFAKLDDKAARHRALYRASGLLALVVFPLAVGLGAVADTLVRAVFDERWYGLAPMLLVLSVLSIFRPVGWLIQSYLQVEQRTRSLMYLELLKSASVLIGVYLLSRLGVLWACAGVGLAFGLYAAASLWVIHRSDGLSYGSLLRPYLPPLVSCAPMVGAVIALRAALVGSIDSWLLVIAEILVGALTYALSALVLAGPMARDFIQLFRDAVKRRAGS